MPNSDEPVKNFATVDDSSLSPVQQARAKTQTKQIAKPRLRSKARQGKKANVENIDNMKQFTQGPFSEIPVSKKDRNLTTNENFNENLIFKEPFAERSLNTKTIIVAPVMPSKNKTTSENGMWTQEHSKGNT